MDLADELLERIVGGVAHSPVHLEERELRPTVMLREDAGGLGGGQGKRGTSADWESPKDAMSRSLVG